MPLVDTTTMNTVTLTEVNRTLDLRTLKLRQLANIAWTDWRERSKSGIYFGAEPYLAAMMALDSIDDAYGADSGESVVAYFLANATTWRGPVARAVKAELKRRLG